MSDHSTACAVLAAALVLCCGIGPLADDRVADDASPWLGVYLLDEIDGGIRVVAVVPGGPASVAGLRTGDLLVRAAGRQLADQQVLTRVLAKSRVDERLVFEVLRGGEPITIEVRPSVHRRRPAPVAPGSVPVAPPPGRAPQLWSPHGSPAGLRSVSMTAELRAHYGSPEDRGVLLVQVEPDSVAERAGLRVGDVLVGVGDLTIRDPGAVDLALQRWNRRAALPLRIVRDRNPQTLELAGGTASLVRGKGFAPLDRSARARQIERSIAVLERQIEILRKQLAELNRRPEPPKPANPDR